MPDPRAALDHIPILELAKRANVAPATVTRLKLRGDFTRNAASERIRQALIDDGLWPEDGEAATVQCDHGTPLAKREQA